MTPQLIFAIIALVQEAITLEPELQAQLQTIFSKPNPTPEDWQALRLQVLGKSYADYVPASALPAPGAGGVSGGVTTPPETKSPVSGQPDANAEAQNSAPATTVAVGVKP